MADNPTETQAAAIAVAESPDDQDMEAYVTYIERPQRPNVDHLVTEDDTPVDNLASEKNQRLLTEPLYSSWAGPGTGRVFLAAANVGLYAVVNQPTLVPDVLLSLDVQPADDWWAKYNRAYMVWELGKLPELALEIVSNTRGNELTKKLTNYARINVPYYVVYDPSEQLKGAVLRVFGLHEGEYVELDEPWFPKIGLGLTLWDGVFEGRQDRWLRWCDEQGQVIPTGAERAEQERERAKQEHARAQAEYERAQAEHERAQAEHERAESEYDRAERMLALLREHGIAPPDDA